VPTLRSLLLDLRRGVQPARFQCAGHQGHARHDVVRVFSHICHRLVGREVAVACPAWRRWSLQQGEVLWPLPRPRAASPGRTARGMPSKRQTASSARLMALNSMWAMACSSAARPSGLKGERRGTLAGCTSVGRSGRPGKPGGSLPAWGLASAIKSVAACVASARAAATFCSG
jgi:hypothetical protein